MDGFRLWESMSYVYYCLQSVIPELETIRGAFDKSAISQELSIWLQWFMDYVYIGLVNFKHSTLVRRFLIQHNSYIEKWAVKLHCYKTSLCLKSQLSECQIRVFTFQESENIRLLKLVRQSWGDYFICSVTEHGPPQEHSHAPS